VRIADLRIDLPDLGPEPGLAQETAGDVPKGVALDHRVTLRVRRIQLYGLRGGNYTRYQQSEEKSGELLARLSHDGPFG
jgi:hypothetical protein